MSPWSFWIRSLTPLLKPSSGFSLEPAWTAQCLRPYMICPSHLSNLMSPLLFLRSLLQSWWPPFCPSDLVLVSETLHVSCCLGGSWFLCDCHLFNLQFLSEMSPPWDALSLGKLKQLPFITSAHFVFIRLFSVWSHLCLHIFCLSSPESSSGVTCFQLSLERKELFSPNFGHKYPKEEFDR